MKTCLHQSHKLWVTRSRGEFVASCSCAEWMSDGYATPDEAMDRAVDEHYTELLPGIAAVTR